MSVMLIRDPLFIKNTAKSVNASLDEGACQLLASEVELTLRLVIQVHPNFRFFTKRTPQDTLSNLTARSSR